MASIGEGRPMEILMVEDSLTCAQVTMGALRRGRIAHRLTWLQDGSDGLDFLERRGRFRRAPQPDLILLDLGLPKIDGRDVLARMKANPHLMSIPVVIMTASQSDEDRAESERLDVAAYLTKPVDLEKFLLVVGQLRHCWRDDMILPTA